MYLLCSLEGFVIVAFILRQIVKRIFTFKGVIIIFFPKQIILLRIKVLTLKGVTLVMALKWVVDILTIERIIFESVTFERIFFLQLIKRIILLL